MSLPPVLKDVRETTWRVIGLAALVQIGASLFINAVLFRRPANRVLHVLHQATGGLVEATLVASLLALALVGAVIVGLGRLRLADVGWRRQALLPGLLTTLGFWIVLHLGIAVGLWIDGRDFAIHPYWERFGANILLGSLIAQLLGNALAEETMFRGFLLPQLHVKAARSCPWWLALLLALLVSQVFFALCHLPNRIFNQGRWGPELVWDQLRLVRSGLLVAVLYLATRNLFIPVGVHALGNTPTLLLDAPGGLVAHCWEALAVLLILGWPAARWWRGRWFSSQRAGSHRKH
jgi:hypothetical protein